jgi:hypothetical protein
MRQGSPALQSLRQHEMEMQVRVSDLEVQVGQLVKQQLELSSDAGLRLNKPIAKAQHDLTVARVDLDATRSQIADLEHERQTYVTTTPAPPHLRLMDRLQLDKMVFGIFLLMLPIVFALARRIWVRGAPKASVALDPETSTRLLRIEEAVESIAVEVERIGEGQRFTTKLLSERQAEVAGRAIAPSAPATHREPGTITPH